jgi:uncharacterized protein YrzB (UPF0473 family)
VERVRAEGRDNRAVDEMAAVYILQGFLDVLRKEASMQDNTDDMFQWNEGDDSAITLFDDEGNASHYDVLSSHEHNGCLYLLVATADAADDEGDSEEEVVEVLHFKCITSEDDDMTFELVDEDHEDYPQVQALFKDDYTELGIITEE